MLDGWVVPGVRAPKAPREIPATLARLVPKAIPATLARLVPKEILALKDQWAFKAPRAIPATLARSDLKGCRGLSDLPDPQAQMERPGRRETRASRDRQAIPA